MKVKLIFTVFSLVLFGIAVYLVGWKICLAMFLMVWGNNLTMHSKKGDK